jgi:YfiH family protein
MLTAPNLSQFDWIIHGFGGRDSAYPPGITTLRQIHSVIILEATEPGKDRFAEGDGLIARQPGTIVGVRTADCVPILIADARTRAVAAVHAGWRGTADGIAGNAVIELAARFGSRPQDLHAAVGPAIGVCCYEVGPEVARRFDTNDSRLDLAAINKRQLIQAGVSDIWQAGECTFCESGRYFSFRREKDAAGRMVSFVGSL